MKNLNEKLRQKKRPSCNSADSENVQLKASNNRHFNTAQYCPKTMRKLARDLLQDLALLGGKHLSYRSAIRSEPLLVQYKALVLLDNKEVEDA